MGSNILKKVVLYSLFIASSIPVFSQNTVEIKIKHLSDVSARQAAEQTARTILNEMNDAYWTGRQPALEALNIPDTARGNLLALWNTRPFFCPEPQLFLPAIRRMGGAFEVRGVPLLFGNRADESKSFEEGIFVFTPDGRLDNIYLGLPEHQYKQVMAGQDLQDLRRRQVILDFVENFRTAYNRKDLDFLEKVFSDNALIIVGKVILEEKSDPEFMKKSLGSERVELIRLNKRQYLDGLKKVFGKNAFIQVGFDAIEIIQHKGKPDFYGVNLTQSWSSSGYSDNGYLFLLIDFRKEEEPQVWVRAWQPSEFTKKEEVLTLDQFILQ